MLCTNNIYHQKKTKKTSEIINNITTGDNI
jgi:hypothetical protein